MLLHCVLKALQGIVDGAEGKNDLGQFTLQCLQLVVVDGTSYHAVAIQRLFSIQSRPMSTGATTRTSTTSTCWFMYVA